MLSYKTPGVYIEEINSLPPAIAPVSTAIPVFIGRNVLRGGTTDPLIGKPVRITSILDFSSIFKVPEERFEYTISYKRTTGPTATSPVKIENPQLTIGFETSEVGTTNGPKSLMYYALQMYFGNGGGPCYVCSVADIDSTEVDLTANYTRAFTALKTLDEPTLLVCTDLALTNSAVNAATIQNDMLSHCEIMQDRFAILDVLNAVPGNTTPENLISGFRTYVGNTAEQRMHGAAYYPYVLTSLKYVYTEYGSKAVKVTLLASNYTTAANGTVTAVPDDPATTSVNEAITSVVTTLGDAFIKKNFNSIYTTIKNRIRNVRVIMPPSSAIAGVYAMTDRTRNVWKAPANVGLNMVQMPMLNITRDFNDNLNSPDDGKAVNAIRKFTGKGIKVWGGRTLHANDLNWRFVNVRREVTWIEDSIKNALLNMVFEPNNANTWTKAKAMTENFLSLIWRQGGLAGAKAEDAFQVNIGINSTMTPEEVAEGIMILEVVLVPPRPAEVIVLRVSQKLQVS
jgi:uncharacterized protein